MLKISGYRFSGTRTPNMILFFHILARRSSTGKTRCSNASNYEKWVSLKCWKISVKFRLRGLITVEYISPEYIFDNRDKAERESPFTIIKNLSRWNVLHANHASYLVPSTWHSSWQKVHKMYSTNGPIYLYLKRG